MWNRKTRTAFSKSYKMLTIKRYQDCCNLLSRKLNSVKSQNYAGARREREREKKEFVHYFLLLLSASRRAQNKTFSYLTFHGNRENSF